jgi:hypothetical protein
LPILIVSAHIDKTFESFFRYLVLMGFSTSS